MARECHVGRGLRFRDAFLVHNDAGSHYTPHSHVFNEIVLVQSGRYRARLGNDEYIALPGDILLYTARTPHEEWVESKDTVMTWTCWFYGDVFEPDEPIFRHDNTGKIQTFLAELCSLYTYRLFTGHETAREQECRDILVALVDELNRTKQSGSADVIEKSRAYIRSRLAEPLTVPELARHAGLSRCYFSHLYRTLTGLTPSDDIKRLRVEEAKRLIETTTLPLREIAPKVGIANEYYLSRLLKSLLKTGVRQLRHASPEE